MSKVAAFYADLALHHTFIDRECGDHTVDACSCGFNDGLDPAHEYNLYARHLREVFEDSAQDAPQEVPNA